MNKDAFQWNLICATNLESSNNVRRKHLATALSEAATLPGLQDQLEAISIIYQVAKTVRHLIDTQPTEQ